MPAWTKHRSILLAFPLLFLILIVLILKIFDLSPLYGHPRPPPGPQPKYKTVIEETHVPVVDNFPFAAQAKSISDIPPPLPWNAPPLNHVPEVTPLFIGFTRNWPILQQCVVSYILAGWPPSDIYVVDNTGTMLSNQQGLLSISNPSYLDHYRLTQVLGVHVITAPTLLTFAQLQNFFLYTAQVNKWTHYFWSHMDVVVLSDEAVEPYTTFYARAVQAMRETLAIVPDPARKIRDWGLRFFRYDMLTLVHVKAFVDVGGWDTMIPFYTGDCDFYFRLRSTGYQNVDYNVGHVFDVARTFPDLRRLFRENTTTNAETCADDADPESLPWSRNDCRYRSIRRELDRMQHDKLTKDGGRNYWQARQHGGKGEPFWRHPDGFETAIQMTMEAGRRIFAEKWGHRDCNLDAMGLKPPDAWRVEKDWKEECKCGSLVP